MNNKLARRIVWCLIVLLALPVSATTSLRPGTSVTVDCVNRKGQSQSRNSPAEGANIALQLNATLDKTGTILSLTLQNTSTNAPEAACYAIDLGLPTKFIQVTRMEASFAGFPSGARWEGPTDVALPTNATGFSTFAAREIIAGGIGSYLKKSNALSSGFLGVGQSGRITVKLAPTADAANRPLLLNPVAYFLAPDPAAPEKRTQIAATALVSAN